MMYRFLPNLFFYPLFYKVISLLLLFLVLSPVQAAKPAKKPQPVIVSPVKLQQISDRIEALGTARANESVNITANVSEKVQRIHFEDGQQVKAGDILVELQHDEEQANLEQATSLLGERKLALKRLLRLEKQKLAPTDELDKARLGVEQARANINALQARINDRIIRASFDGIVGLRQISVGALVETGDLITTLDDTHLIKLDFTVPAVYLSDLKPGLKITARTNAIANHVYNGEVKSIDSRIDPVTRSVKVRAVLSNDDNKIIPGMLMQVDLLRNTRDALLIPEATLIPLAENNYVMVRAQKDGKDIAERRQVTIGTRLPGKVEITKGLTVNDQVITHGGNKTRPGSAITILAIDDGSKDIRAIIKGKAIKGKQP